MFVQFLGDHARFEFCCNEAEIEAYDPLGLSAAERLAVWIYSSTDDGWYARINGELWNGPCSDQVLKMAALLNSGLSKLPPYHGKVYRGFNTPDMDAFLETYGIGGLIRWPGFTSSTLNPEKAFEGNVLFIIHSKSGRILNSYADKPSEEEVLFSSACRFVVISLEREEDFAIIELEEHL